MKILSKAIKNTEKNHYKNKRIQTQKKTLNHKSNWTIMEIISILTLKNMIVKSFLER